MLRNFPTVINALFTHNASLSYVTCTMISVLILRPHYSCSVWRYINWWYSLSLLSYKMLWPILNKDSVLILQILNNRNFVYVNVEDVESRRLGWSRMAGYLMNIHQNLSVIANVMTPTLTPSPGHNDARPKNVIMLREAQNRKRSSMKVSFWMELFWNMFILWESTKSP